MSVIGVTQDEAISYWRQKAQSNSKKLQVKELPVVNPDFLASDIRSRTKLYWYAFAGGKFSPDPKAYPNCQGVVGWINPYLSARGGDKIYVVLPEQRLLQYGFILPNTFMCDHCGRVEETNSYNGRANTLAIIEHSKKRPRSQFPAAEFAFYNCFKGFKRGDVFLPAREQLSRVVVNGDGVRKALKLIDGTFEGCLWSSTEEDWDNACFVRSNDGFVGYFNKKNTLSVSCFLAY